MMVMAKRKAAKRKRRTFLKPEMRTVPLADAISEAFGEITELSDEMTSWKDSLEEKLSHTPKYEEVSETADALENISEPDVPESLQKISVTFLPLAQRARPYSRADRMGQATYLLDQCAHALEEFESASEVNTEPVAEAIELREALEAAKDEAESVSFPGMY